MCTVSMVATDWLDRNKLQQAPVVTFVLPVSQDEFQALKREVESLKKLLKAAKIYDDETGQPDCEDAEKVALLRGLARHLGVDLDEVFGEMPT